MKRERGIVDGERKRYSGWREKQVQWVGRVRYNRWKEGVYSGRRERISGWRERVQWVKREGTMGKEGGYSAWREGTVGEENGYSGWRGRVQWVERGYSGWRER